MARNKTREYAEKEKYLHRNRKLNVALTSISELRAEIDKLRNQTGNSLQEDSDDNAHAASLAEIASLKSKLSEKEKAMLEMTRSWQERLKSSEAKKKEETKLLEVELKSSDAKAS